MEEPKDTTLGCKLWKLWVFTEKGVHDIWSCDDTDKNGIINTHFLPNNIYGTYVPTKRSDIFLYKVDTTKTLVSDFYTWNDMLTGTECENEIWRPFFWIGNTHYGESDEWGWEEELKEIRVGKFGSVDTLWKVLRESAIHI